MVKLLNSALSEESASPRDKFVFLSESTLPVKPFRAVYEALTENDDSDFCVSPEDAWLKQARSHAVLVKHSQWVVLSRAHAGTMVERWRGDRIMWSLKVDLWGSARGSDAIAVVPK